VLAGTFAALGTLPVTFLAELGFAVAFGVLLETIVVRSVLVTALNLDLGRWVWWPSKLLRYSSPEHEHLEGQPFGRVVGQRRRGSQAFNRLAAHRPGAARCGGAAPRLPRSCPVRQL
jgi:MMPL family